MSIHLVFNIYNRFINHLEKSIGQLQRKKAAWKQLMLAVVHAPKEKLCHYYGMTDEIHEDLYAISTIIAPQPKLKPYQQRLSDNQSLARIQTSVLAISELQ